jgi:hypothetical protein
VETLTPVIDARYIVLLDFAVALHGHNTFNEKLAKKFLPIIGPMEKRIRKH